ncbi:sugar transferase [Gordonia jinhuaensis]|uniref:Polyprenyl glycosylphosphotransferase n=1 Tax=Gordonia jinhuaensis TaxID=1517702 RepID=A0A916SX77_9ACTN|nr:sugar transferase [Gordonia jinhuaensis]GGB21922.1 polyprenyl glycosylphosphotransferase [Gordonia jinhuaensis]
MYRYLRRIVVTDFLSVALAVVVAQWVRFGGASVGATSALIPMWMVSGFLAVVWLIALRLTHSADRRVVAEGGSEYSRVVGASFLAFGVLAILDSIFRLNLARGFLVVAFPLGAAALLFTRWMWRCHLTGRRRRGLDLNQVLVIGSVESAKPLIERLLASPGLGYEVVGVCLPVDHKGGAPLEIKGKIIPMYGEFDSAREAVALSGATVVAVTSAEVLGHSRMRELSWEMEGMDVDMVVAPGVVDVSGPRMMVRPVAGLPLLHIDKPRYEGANRYLKATFDRLGSLVLLVMITPVLIACAIAVKCESRGPIFYRAERIGLNNEPFVMWKFRSMVADADKQVDNLVHLSDGNGVLFKMREDPRVTRVGKILRRLSLDEIPQLFNVLGGSMSLVGPRPPLRSEVEQYSGQVARRMLVRPGMTGLWQVSGRSDLSWEESVRLDLSYVENWSIMQDMLILWRTAKAVIGSDGAY